MSSDMSAVLYGVPPMDSNVWEGQDEDGTVALYACPAPAPFAIPSGIVEPLPSPEEMKEIALGSVDREVAVPECIGRAMRRKCHACGAYPRMETDAELGYIIKCPDCGKVSAWGKNIEAVAKMWISMDGGSE